MDNATQHKFEKAGLGKAPFRLVDVVEKRGPILVGTHNGVESWAGAPGQPMGTCDYCGTGIALCHVIRSADGREFIVGSECVTKTGDRGLVRQAKVATAPRRAAAAKAAKAREEDRVKVLADRLENDADLQALLAAQPHPKVWAAAKGQTLLDSVRWMMDRAGHAGRMKMVRLVAKLEA